MNGKGFALTVNSLLEQELNRNRNSHVAAYVIIMYRGKPKTYNILNRLYISIIILTQVLLYDSHTVQSK